MVSQHCTHSVTPEVYVLMFVKDFKNLSAFWMHLFR